MKILAIDPGTEQSARLIWDTESWNIYNAAIESNESVLKYLQRVSVDVCVIEWIESYGMPVGAQVFDTCRWIGRFQQAYADPTILYPRRKVKLALCNSARAKDSNVSRALKDKLGEPGTKKNPGRTYGIKTHLWAALGLAVGYWESEVATPDELISNKPILTAAQG